MIGLNKLRGEFEMEDLLKQRQFEKIEKVLVQQFNEKKDDVDILFELAMVYLQYPFENEERSIKYLDKILEIDKYNFQALIIKMYLQNYYYGEMDKDFEVLTNYEWNDGYKMSIVYYIYAWKFHWWNRNIQIEEKIKWISKSIEMSSELVYTHYRLGDLFAKLNKHKEANMCYKQALSNVKSTDFLDEESLNPQVFIDEYITGVRMSTINYESLRKKVMKNG